jgi:hypothetical protein
VQCWIAENANLVRIEKESFSECHWLRSLCFPKDVEVVSEDCFRKWFSVFQLRFVSAESLKRLVGDSPVDEAVENL